MTHTAAQKFDLAVEAERRFQPIIVPKSATFMWDVEPKEKKGFYLRGEELIQHRSVSIASGMTVRGWLLFVLSENDLPSSAKPWVSFEDSSGQAYSVAFDTFEEIPPLPVLRKRMLSFTDISFPFFDKTMFGARSAKNPEPGIAK
jgi:hypothetical protein